MNILVTGSKGFIGKNLISRLKEYSSFVILEYDKDNTLDELASLIKVADFIIHLAGSNRPLEISEYQIINFGLTETITKLLKNYNLHTPVIIASSTQADLDNPYGISKKRAEEILLEYSKNGSSVYVLKLTNVFGKWCRPNYNSVVATFCFNIANDIPINISDPGKLLKLIYIDDVIRKIIELIKAEAVFENPIEIQPFYEINLENLAKLIYSFKESRKNLVLPDVSDEFTKKLYSTYLTYLKEDEFNYSLTKNCDNRGDLTELIKSIKYGQFFISTTKPGITRGNHYHHTKTEKFIVIKGKAQINFRKIDEEAIITYEVSGDKIEVVDIPPGYTHNITNVGDDELITLFWANEIFNPEKPDTKFLEV